MRSYCSNCSRTVEAHCRDGWQCIGVNRSSVIFAKTEVELRPMEMPTTLLFDYDRKSHDNPR